MQAYPAEFWWAISVGTVVLLAVSVGIILTVALGQRRSLSVKQEQLEETAKNEKKYRNLFENSLVGMIRFALLTTDVLDSNRAVLRIFRCSTKEELGRFLKLNASKEMASLFDTLQSKGSAEGFEMSLKRVDGKPLWQIVAEKVRDSWNENGNCMLMAGATYPAEIKKLRDIMDEMTFLMPGVGKQGGNLEEAIRAGLNSGKKGLIVNASRSIIYAENPAEEARKLKEEINKYR